MGERVQQCTDKEHEDKKRETRLFVEPVCLCRTIDLFRYLAKVISSNNLDINTHEKSFYGTNYFEQENCVEKPCSSCSTLGCQRFGTLVPFPSFFFSFSLQTGFSSFGALLCFLSETQKIVAAPPEKKGNTRRKRRRNKVFLHSPPFVLPCVLHTRLLLLPRKERKRKGHEKSIRLFFLSIPLLFPLPMEEAFKREEKGRGDRGRKEEKEAL